MTPIYGYCAYSTFSSSRNAVHFPTRFRHRSLTKAFRTSPLTLTLTVYVSDLACHPHFHRSRPSVYFRTDYASVRPLFGVRSIDTGTRVLSSSRARQSKPVVARGPRVTRALPPPAPAHTRPDPRPLHPKNVIQALRESARTGALTLVLR